MLRSADRGTVTTLRYDYEVLELGDYFGRSEGRGNGRMLDLANNRQDNAAGSAEESPTGTRSL